MSVTTLPMSRPRMNTPMAITRAPDSRLMFIAPSLTAMSATSASRTWAPSAVSTQDLAHVVGVGPRVGRQSHDDAEALLALPDLGRVLAAERGLDRVLDVGDVEPVSGGARPIDGDLQLRHLPGAIDEGAGDARRGRHRVEDGRRVLPQRGPVRAKHLDHDLAVDLRNALEDVVTDRLREARVDAGNRVERVVHLGDQLFLRDVPRPFRCRLHVHEELGHVDQLGVGPVLRPAGLRNHRAHFRKLPQKRADARALARRLADGDAVGQHRIDPDGPFVQLGQKLAAELRGGAQAQREQRHGAHDDGAAAGERRVEHGAVDALAGVDQPVLLVRTSSSAARSRAAAPGSARRAAIR